MTKNNLAENYYDLLKVSPKATVSEITNAYVTAKNTFSKDSIATYSLMGADESSEILAQIETAYMTLTNPERRQKYDTDLSGSSVVNLNIPNPIEIKHASPTPITAVSPVDNPSSQEDKTAELNTQSATSLENTGAQLSLAEAREKCGYTIADVARITKIPTKYIKAIEEYDIKHLPAKVYIQGFIKNLSHLYRLDDKIMIKEYFQQLETLSGSKPA